jgi:hypothetical protein
MDMEGKYALLGTPVAFTILALITVVIRFWMRIKHNARLGWDDWLMLIAMVSDGNYFPKETRTALTILSYSWTRSLPEL